MDLEVKIYSASEPWYVYVYDPGKSKLVKRFSKGLSKIADETERMVAAKALKISVEKEIRSGWKPKAGKTGLPSPYAVYMTVAEAYDRAWSLFEASDISPGTLKDYKSHKKYFLQAVSNLKWERSQFADLEAYHISTAIEEMMRIRNPGKRNAYYNKHLGVVKSFYKILQKNFVIRSNAALGMSERRHVQDRREVMTPQEQTRVITHFQTVLPQFVLFMKVLYHLGIREKEMLLMKCGMLNTETWFFDLPAEIAKNRKRGIILVPDDIREDLLRLDLSNPDHYLFGNLKYRSWSTANQYLPSAVPMVRSSATRLWKKEVKDGLGIQKDLYSLKHKGVNDKQRNGMPFEVISGIMRHSSTDITAIYGTEKEIIDQVQNRDKFGTFK